MKLYRVALFLFILNLACVIVDAMGVSAYSGASVPELARIELPESGGLLGSVIGMIRWAVVGAKVLLQTFTGAPVAALLAALGVPAVVVTVVRAIITFLYVGAFIQIVSGRPVGA